MKQINDETAENMWKMVLAAFSFSIMATFVKFACQTLPSMEVVFFRSAFGLIPMSILIVNARASWFGKTPKIHALRGVFGFAALSLHFYAIAKLDLGTAVMLNYTAPMFVVILAHIMLREKTEPRVTAAILFSFFGLYLLASPHFEAKPIPILLGILSGLFAAIAYVLIRFSKEDKSPYTIIFYFTAISTIASLPFVSVHFVRPTFQEWLGLIGVSVGAVFGQVFLTRSIQKAPISYVLPFSYLTPVFATFFGLLIWKERLTLQTLMGGAIIILCGISIYFLRERPPYVPLEE